MMCMLIRTLSCTPKIYANIANLYFHEVENNNCSIKCSQGRHYSESIYIHKSTLNQQWLIQVVQGYPALGVYMVCEKPSQFDFRVQVLTTTHSTSNLCTDSVMLPSLYHSLQSSCSKAPTKRSHPSEHAATLKAGNTRHNSTLHNAAQAE